MAGWQSVKLSSPLVQVLTVNAKDQVFALAEYDRVRKPDMQALRHLDSISGRIWGGGA